MFRNYGIFNINRLTMTYTYIASSQFSTPSYRTTMTSLCGCSFQSVDPTRKQWQHGDPGPSPTSTASSRVDPGGRARNERIDETEAGEEQVSRQLACEEKDDAAAVKGVPAILALP
jgi:hypothetical protein